MKTSKSMVQLNALLKERGPHVSRCKAKLIHRLKHPLSGPKPKPWQHSDTKKTLTQVLLNPKLTIHNMSIEKIPQV